MLRGNLLSLSTTKSLTFVLLLKALHASWTSRAYRFLTHEPTCFTCLVVMYLRKTFPLLKKHHSHSLPILRLKQDSSLVQAHTSHLSRWWELHAPSKKQPCPLLKHYTFHHHPSLCASWGISPRRHWINVYHWLCGMRLQRQDTKQNPSLMTPCIWWG